MILYKTYLLYPNAINKLDEITLLTDTNSGSIKNARKGKRSICL